MFLEFFLLLLGTVIIFVVVQKWRHQYWLKKGVPQLKPHLIFGDFKSVVTGKSSLYDFFLELYNSGKNSGHKLLGIYSIAAPELVIIDRELIKLILINDFANFTSHGVYHHKTDLLTMNMFNMEGHEWKIRRAKMSPIFSTGKVKTIFQTLIENSGDLEAFLGTFADKKQPMPAKETFGRFTIGNIANIVFGLKTDIFTEPDNLFKRISDATSKPQLSHFFLETFFNHNFLANLGHKAFPEEITNSFAKIVLDTIKYRKNNNIRRKDFVDLMLQTKLQESELTFTDNEIISESFLFFLAGSESSSTTSSCTLFEMARNPIMQEKLREEIITVLNRYNGQLTLEALTEMSYLDQVVKETLRLYPVATFIPRMSTSNYTIPGTNILIEKGTRIYIPLSGLQRDPEFYENPDEYNPDNFAAEKLADRPDFTWIPFGIGPRQCIGLRLGYIQSKVGIITALTNYKLSLHESTKPPFEISPGHILLSFKKDPLLNVTRL